MSSSLLRRYRVYRAVLALLAAANLATVALDALDGHPGVLLFNVAICAFLIALVAARTVAIHRLEEEAKPKPDYSAIASMEREVYGEVFKHEGSPARTVSRPESRWDGRTTHPDTTQPASIEDYALWLQGYIKRGGKPTHFYDYPFPEGRFRYASSTVTIDSDYEYGSSGRSIIVARNVTTKRTNPAGGFGGWAHTKLYFMHGYRTNDCIIPVYSNPEFDEFRT